MEREDKDKDKGNSKRNTKQEKGLLDWGTREGRGRTRWDGFGPWHGLRGP